MTGVVALHPEAVPGEPLEVRWVVPAGALPFVGAVDRAPAALQSLVDAGVLAAVVVEPAAVRTRLGDGRDWRAEGAAVRTAVEASAGDPGAWSAAADPDAVLRAAVDQVLTGPVGDYIRSHGGALEPTSVRGGRVGVRFSGACAHCPASDHTLTTRFEGAVRALFPALEAVDAVRVEAPALSGPRFLGIPVRRRR